MKSLAGQPWLADPALARVFAALGEAGGVSRIAGGAVRNALMGEPIADIDIATTLTPDQVMAAGKKADLGVKPTGIDHGTVMLIADHKPFEVTTLRVDAETFGRKARVAFTGDWAADAGRRDFTMNALYCDADGTILDLVDGYRDIARRRVRFVGDARKRIKEDYLRILRFFRFHARYGKGAPDADGLKACARLRKGLRRLSRERIRQELLKLLAAPRAAETVAVMKERGILAEFLPKPFALDILSRLQRIDATQNLDADPILRLHALIPDAADLGPRLRLSGEEASRISRMRAAPTLSPILREQERRAVLYQLGKETWRDAVRLAWARAKPPGGAAAWRELLDFPDGWSIPKFPVTGHDVIRAGVKSGKDIGAALRRLEDWWIASDFKPAKSELLARLKT
jgi:tRNA nucleotidyltransferase/poly(A) polymerase